MMYRQITASSAYYIFFNKIFKLNNDALKFKLTLKLYIGRHYAVLLSKTSIFSRIIWG